jgi:hypothetical protein
MSGIGLAHDWPGQGLGLQEEPSPPNVPVHAEEICSVQIPPASQHEPAHTVALHAAWSTYVPVHVPAEATSVQLPPASQHAPPQGLLGAHEVARPWKPLAQPAGVVVEHVPLPAAQHAPTVGAWIVIE